MPLAPRSLAAAVFGSPRSQLILGGMVTCSVIALQLISETKPWEPMAPVELSNQLVALMGFAWCAIQFWTLRRDADARRAWSAAGAGLLLLVLEDNIGRVFPIANHVLAELATAGLWLFAAGLLFVCGRRYAMRRSVMPAMRTALAIQLVTQGFVLAAILTAPLRAHGYTTLVDTVAEVGELIAALTYVSALLMASFAPFKSYRRPVSELGRKAREVFADFNLEKMARYPTAYRVLHGPVVRDFTFAAMAIMFARRGSASARNDGAVSRLGQAAGLLSCGLKGVDPISYYLLGLYRPGAAPDAAMTRLETKNGLTSVIQKAGRRAPAPSEMSDKLDFWRICEANGVVSAPILGWLDQGVFEHFAAREAFDTNLFVKDRRGRGGKNTLDYERVGPFLYRAPGGAVITLSALLEELSELSTGRRLILQPKLANHPEVADLARDSLVVFRVVTCLGERDEPHVTHGVLRVLRRFEPSWPSFPEKEWGAAIDLETGELGQLTGDVAKTCGQWHDRHPITGAVVAGRTLASWPALAEAASAAHRVFRSRAIVGWDMAMTPEGPVILEGNSNMDFCFIQRCYRTPVGLSPLGPLLDRHLDEIVAARTAGLATRPAPATVAGAR